MKPYRFFAALLLGIFFWTAPAQAHQLWINMTDYSPELWQHPKYAPEPRAKTIAYFGWGHKYPLADFLDKKYLETIHQIEPDGTKKEIVIGESGFRAVEIEMNTEGPRIFTAAITPGYYQKVKGKEDFYEMRYEMYSKALVSVGATEGNPFEKPVGQRIEIIPAANPNTLKPGDTLSLTVLFDGKPAGDFTIKAIPMYSGTDTFKEVTTDEDGTATISVDAYFGPWLVTASRMDDSTGVYKDKCNRLYNLATLTFSVEKE